MEEKKIIYIKSAKIDLTKFFTVEITNISDYRKLLNIDRVFIIDDFFIFFNDNFLYKIATNGYRTIEDFYKSYLRKSTNAESYYNSVAIENGFNNRIEYFDAVENGFIGRYERNTHNKTRYFKEMNLESYGKNVDARNYYKIKSLDYKSFDDYVKGIKCGAENGIQFYEISDSGFKNYYDYKEAIKLKIKTADEYYEIVNRGFKSEEQIEFYLWLKKFPQSKYKTYDELILIKYIESLQPSKKSASKIFTEFKKQLKEIFPDEIEENKNKRSSERNTLLNLAIENEGKLKDFLLNNELVQFYGFYDEQGEYFEKIGSLIKSERNVYIDGSNVAYIDGEKPYIRTIYLVVNHLVELGFDRKKIKIIADMSIKHKISDKENLPKLKNDDSFIYAPANTDADEFIISYARENNGIIISNDRYRDYMEKDKWASMNIERIRIPVMIIDDVVKFSGNIELFID